MRGHGSLHRLSHSAKNVCLYRLHDWGFFLRPCGTNHHSAPAKNDHSAKQLYHCCCSSAVQQFSAPSMVWGCPSLPNRQERSKKRYQSGPPRGCLHGVQPLSRSLCKPGTQSLKPLARCRASDVWHTWHFWLRPSRSDQPESPASSKELPEATGDSSRAAAIK